MQQTAGREEGELVQTEAGLRGKALPGLGEQVKPAGAGYCK